MPQISPLMPVPQLTNIHSTLYISTNVSDLYLMTGRITNDFRQNVDVMLAFTALNECCT